MRGTSSRLRSPLDGVVFEATTRCKFVLAGINRVAHFWSLGRFQSADQ
jgi:hypothetical protein